MGTKEIVLLPEERRTFDVINYEDIIGEWLPGDYLGIEVGKTYEVTLDGVKYSVVACEKDETRYKKVFLGDIELVDSGRTSCEIPFGYLEVIPKEGVTATPWDDYFPYDFVTSLPGDSHTLGIKEIIETEDDSGGDLSFIKFFASPDFPYLPKNIFGWRLAQKNGGK